MRPMKNAASAGEGGGEEPWENGCDLAQKIPWKERGVMDCYRPRKGDIQDFLSLPFIKKATTTSLF